MERMAPALHLVWINEVQHVTLHDATKALKLENFRKLKNFFKLS